MIVGGQCQGCRERLDYVLDLNDGTPDIYVRDGGVAFRGGHLCGPCALAVHNMFYERMKIAAREAARTDHTLLGDVLHAMQGAEEAGGPEGAEYLALMRAIADEANRRAAIHSKMLMKQWHHRTLASVCSDCGKPAHASETDDHNRCEACADIAGEPHMTPCDECGAPTPRGATNHHQCAACINAHVRGAP